MAREHSSEKFTRGLFIFSVLLLLGASVFSYRRLEMLNASENNIRLSHRVIIRLERLASFVKDAETSQRGFIITHDSIYLKPYLSAKVSADIVLKELYRLTSTDSIQHGNLLGVEQAVNKRFELLDQTLWTYSRYGNSGQLSGMMRQSRISMYGIRKKIDHMITVEESMLRERNETHGRNVFVTPLSGLLISLIALIVFVLSYIKIFADSRKIRRWNQAADEIRLAKESAAIFQSLIHDLPAAVYTCDNDGYLKLYNKAAVKLWGREPAPGARWGGGAEVYDLEGNVLEELEFPLVKLLRHNKVVQRELLMRRHDGELRAIDVYPQRLFDGAGNKIGALVMILDVTEQRKQKQDLEEAEMRLRVATENSDIATWDLNLATEKLTHSPILNRIFGFEGNEPIRHRELINRVLREDRENVLEPAITKAYETGSYEYEVRILLPDGNTRWIRTVGRLLRNERNEPLRMLGITIDVTAEKISREKIGVLSAIVQYSDDAIISKTLDGIITSWNNAATRIFGYTEEEMIGKHVFTIIPEDRHHEEKVIIETLLSGDRLDHYETQRVTKEGRLVDVSLTISPLKDDFGNVIGASKIARDITRQKLQEKLAEESEVRFRTLVDNAPVMVWMSESDKKASYFNSSWLKFVGKELEEEIGHGWLSSVHPDDLERVLTTFENAYASQEEYYMEFRLRRFDGVYRWISNQAAPRFAGEFIGYLTACSDIDDQVNFSRELGRQVEQRTSELNAMNEDLKHERDFVETILDSSIDVMIVFSKDLTILAFNSAAEKLYEKNKQEVIGKNLFEIFPESKGKSSTDDVMRSLRGEMIHNPPRQSAATPVFFENYMIPLRNPNGEIWASLIVARDVTDAVTAEEQLKELNESLLRKNSELERSNQELASFNHVASHDLQEPLRKIQTFISRLNDPQYFQLEEKTLDYFRRIQDSAARMQLLIDDLLSFSRMSRVQDSMEPVNLNLVLESVLKDLQTRIEEKKARVIAEELPVVNAIAFQFQQVFTNLIGNSLKYAKEGTPPVISISSSSATAQEKIDAGLEADKKYCKIELKDNGIGFEPQYSEQIFDLFQRLHGRREYSGTGIGLTICKKIIENHGGAITASGKPSRGAVFTIFLPAL